MSLLLLEMDFYLWCKEIVEYDYICYDYSVGYITGELEETSIGFQRKIWCTKNKILQFIVKSD